MLRIIRSRSMEKGSLMQFDQIFKIARLIWPEDTQC